MSLLICSSSQDKYDSTSQLEVNERNLPGRSSDTGKFLSLTSNCDVESYLS